MYALAAAGVRGALALAAAGCVACRLAEGQPPAAEERPVPVVAGSVQRRNVPVYLEGLGTAIAWKTVPIRSQVDGKLLEVSFVEGQQVRRGQLLATVDPRPFMAQLRQAEGALARDTALLEQSMVNLKRVAALRTRHLVSKENVDDQQALVNQYRGATLVDQGQIQAARLNVEYAHVRAPFDGTVGIRLVDPGTLVHPGDASGIVILTQLDPMMVLITLPQDELPAITEALRGGPLQVEVFSRDGASPLGTGEVRVIDNQINVGTATIRLKALVPNAQRLLWPNQFVKARVLVKTLRNALVVPATSVQRGPQGPFAYVIGADDRVTPRQVDVARSLGDLSVVSSGLTPGERVVVEGQNQLGPNARISVQAAADGGAVP